MKESKKALVLRTCNEDMTSFGGFVWPVSGRVECQDWDEKPECGNGLHGLLWGEGDGTLFDWRSEAKWLVVEIDEWINLGCTVKFPNGNVVHVGDQKSATDYIYNNGGQGKAIVGLSIVNNNKSEGIAIAGHRGVATVIGDSGNAVVGNYGIATSGLYGNSIAGYAGIATSGYSGVSMVHNDGKAKVGKHGRAIAGVGGKAIAGDFGIATACLGGMAKAGDNGRIEIEYIDDENKFRNLVGYVGEGGIEPNIFYKVKNGRFVRCHKK